MLRSINIHLQRHATILVSLVLIFASDIGKDFVLKKINVIFKKVERLSNHYENHSLGIQ